VQECKDFLLKCFHKDPAKRPSASELRQHEWISKNVIRDKQGAGPGEEKRLEKQIRRISQHNVDLEMLNNEQWLAAMAEKWGDANTNAGHVKSSSENVPTGDRSLKSHVLAVQDSAQKRSNSEGPKDPGQQKSGPSSVSVSTGRVSSLPSALPTSPVLGSKKSRFSNQLQGTVESTNDILLVIVDHEIRRNFLFKYVVYILKVYFNDQSWTITRSANDFKEFYEKVRAISLIAPVMRSNH
jgi:serine/threonine protein kinase